MFSFLKNSIRELKHVVWPSKDETQKYFIVVLTVLIVFWLYLFIASTVFSETLFFFKGLISSNWVETNVPKIDMDSLIINTGSLSNTWISESTWNIIESTWSIIESTWDLNVSTWVIIESTWALNVSTWTIIESTWTIVQ